MKWSYRGFVAAVVITYVAAYVFGLELGSSRNTIPQSARSAPGGYRSFHYWGGGK